MQLRQQFHAVRFAACRAGALSKVIAVAALAVAAAAPAAATPVTLGFGGADWNESGYAVTSDGADPKVGSGAAAACSPSCPAGGSRYLLGSAGSLQITPTRSKTFALTSFDAAKPFAGEADDAGWARYIDVTGYKWDGSTVSQRFALDWLQDGSADFRTFSLGPDFLELRSVSLRSGGAGTTSADDLRPGDPSAAAAATVPEPATIALVAVALLAAAAGSGRRRTKPGRDGA